MRRKMFSRIAGQNSSAKKFRAHNAARVVFSVTMACSEKGMHATPKAARETSA